MREKKAILIAVGENIRRLRTRAGLSQEGLAHKAELDRTYVGGIERGERNVAVLNLCKLAHAMDTTASECLEGVVWETGEFQSGDS